MVNSTCGFCFGPQAFHETPVVVAPVQNKQIRMDTKRQKNDEVNLKMQSGQRRWWCDEMSHEHPTGYTRDTYYSYSYTYYLVRIS